MDSFVFNSFKERFINGETPEYDTWTFWPVNKGFTAEYEPVIEKFRTLDDFISYNKTVNPNTWFNNYKANLTGMSYYYTRMPDVDNAEQPEYITQDTWSNFIVKNPGNDHLEYLFFNSASNWYRQYDVKVELLPDEHGQLVEVSSTIPRGFYFVRTKEELKWCAEKVNGNAYDNAINIVLGDNIGILSQTADNALTNIDFSIGSNPAQPYEGIFYGNGYKITNVNLKCKSDVNGIVGYLGTNGIISTVDIVKNNRVECNKQINLQHLIDNGTDVFAGFLCGKNDGRIEYVRVLDKMTFTNFVPKIYNINNKSDNNNNESTEAYPFYPDYMCYNSLGNIIPYVGYFNEGVFGTYSGYSKVDNTYYSYWNTRFFNENPEVKSYQQYIRSNTYGINNIVSPLEWYYWYPLMNGYTRTNNDGSSEFGFIMHSTPEQNRKNVLWYDSNVIMKTKQTIVQDAADFRVVSDGLMYLNNIYTDVLNAKDMSTYYMSNIEYAHYFDTALKLSQQNRIAYYVSPIVGMNNGTIEHVREECEMNTSGTFVGFMGGVAGKQNNSILNDMVINVSSTDRVWDPSENLKLSYNIRNYEEIPTTQTDFLLYTKKSIKNIGGLFGSLTVSDSLDIFNTSAYFYNGNKVNINKDAAVYVYDDYSFMNRFGTLAAVAEYNTSNISDKWTTVEAINNPANRCIKINNCVFSYNEGFQTVDTTASDIYDFYAPYLSYYGGEVQLANDFMFGVVSPLIAEIKPLYLTTPSILSSPFFNTENIKLSATSQNVTTTPVERQTMDVLVHYNYDYTLTEPTIENGKFTEERHDFSNFIKNDVSRIGLYTMDQYLGASYSNYGNIYSINTEIDLPGVANYPKTDPAYVGVAGGIIDRLNCTAAENFDIDIRNIAGKLINFENSYITNNYAMGENPFTTVTVPQAAYIYPAYGITGSNPETDIIAITGKGVPQSTTAVIGTYNANKVLSTYPYFGSDLIINRNTGLVGTDLITNWGIYQINYSNPHFNENVFDIVRRVLFRDDETYDPVASYSIHSNDYVRDIIITVNELLLKGRPFTSQEPVTSYENLYRVKLVLDYTNCPANENPYSQEGTIIERDCSPGTLGDGYYGFTDDIIETIKSTIQYKVDRDSDVYVPAPVNKYANINELYTFINDYCNGARKGSWIITSQYNNDNWLEIRTYTYIPFCDEYWPYESNTFKKGYFPPYNKIGIVRIPMFIYHCGPGEKGISVVFGKSMAFGYTHLVETESYPMKVDSNTGVPVKLGPGGDINFIFPIRWNNMNLIGKYKNGLLHSNNMTVNGLGKKDPNWNPFNDPTNINMFNLDNQTYYGYGDYLATNGYNAIHTVSSKKKYSDYFKYTYSKVYNGPIMQNGIKYNVQFDYGNKKCAGYWFYNHDNVSPSMEYNDDFSYTPNILNIGKTVNEKCIINNHLMLPDVDSFMVSSFAADDFEGLLVTDSKSLPVMYIDVGLGECDDGTTWSYKCKEYTMGTTGTSGLLLEMNSDE